MAKEWILNNSASKYSYSPSTSIISPFTYWYQNENKKRTLQNTKIIKNITKNNGVIVDFGKEVGGYLYIKWGTIQGKKVRIYFSESLEELEPQGDVIWDMLFSRLFFRYIYKGSGNCWWKAPILRGGFRYVLIKPDTTVVAEIKNLKLETDFYIPEKGIYRGFFECSDKRLNQIWYGAAYTMQVATKHPWETFVFGNDKVGDGEWVIFDGAKRDRAVWSYDLSVCIPSYLYSLWNPQAVRNSIITLLSLKGKVGYALKSGYIPHCGFPLTRPSLLTTTFTTFSVYLLWWIRGVYFYYLHTKDAALVKSVFEDIVSALKWIETQTRQSPQTHTPLFYATGFNDFSWDYTIKRKGFSGATNLIWAKTLEETAWLSCEVMQDYTTANKYLTHSLKIRKAIFEKGFKPYNLWDNKLGYFRHTTNDKELLTLEVNALAILFNFVLGKKAENLLNYFRKKLHTSGGTLSSEKPFSYVLANRHNCKVIPSMVAFEVSALMKYGYIDEALDLTRNTWLPMLKQGTATTFWEWYGDNGKIPGAFASLCHPWSAWILQVLNENLTGINPLKGGFEKFMLNPINLLKCQEINNVNFSIPTPKGNICGQWHKEKNKLIYELQLPEKTKGKLLPLQNSLKCIDLKTKKPLKNLEFKNKIVLQLSEK